jgi:hypothetical protein
VKTTIRRRLASQQQKIKDQLAEAVQPNYGGPVLRGRSLRYELAERVQGIDCGGIGMMQQLVLATGLAREIDQRVELLKVHMPYHESDHVLNIAYNILCGGKVLEDIEKRRNDPTFLAALNTASIPDPTTAGDFCRRFDSADIWALMAAINVSRLAVWKQHPTLTKEVARIDVDGTLVPTTGSCKEGMGLSYNGLWSYHPLLVSLANTREPLYLLNRSGNRPSHEWAAEVMDKAIALCRQAGFVEILLRGDTDFSLTCNFDRWDDDNVRFVFGADASKPMVNRAESQPEKLYRQLERRAEREIKTQPRLRPENVKERIVKERGYKNLRLNSEQVVEFEYQPGKCKRPYRVIALRKNITVERGELALFDEIRYFFYITNDRTMTPAEVVFEANQRCNQENLIEQLKNGVRALHAPRLNKLDANWAYMVAASLAWSLKAWAALLLPLSPRWQTRHVREQQLVLRMDFRTFINGFIKMPAQIIRTSRRTVFRLLTYSPWQQLFFRLLDGIGVPA